MFVPSYIGLAYHNPITENVTIMPIHMHCYMVLSICVSHLIFEATDVVAFLLFGVPFININLFFSL